MSRFTLISRVVVVATVLGSSIPMVSAQTLNLPDPPLNYANVPLPAHFSVDPQGPAVSVIATDTTPANNPITDAGATLGRVLFYDTNLSLNRTVSCASCHQQLHGFSDPNQFSIGFAGALTGRHSPGLANVRFYERGRMFWDERATSLEDQALQPFQDPGEMGLTLELLVQRVEEQPSYEDLFTAAFGDAEVTTDRIARAIAQFERAMVSFESRYDVGRAQVNAAGQPFPNFTGQENQGKQLFLAPPPQGFGCARCHSTEAQISAGNGPFNIGLDSEPLADIGAAGTFNQPRFRGSFKVPSLRNIGVRPPYMHDGRFDSLMEVVDFYSDGIQAHPNLSPQLTTNNRPGGPPIQFNMTQAQKNALVAFMDTLTDFNFLTDERFSDPFSASPPPPELSDFVVGTGSANHGLVDRITLVFDSDVMVDGSGITLTNLTTTDSVTTMQTESMVVDGETWMTITFDQGDSVVTRQTDHSLDDGYYLLTIAADAVTTTDASVAMQSDLVIGDSPDHGLFRLFGDANGDASVNLLDFAAFRGVYGAQSDDADYDPGFDNNGDGSINLGDFAAFRSNYGTSL